MWNSMVLQGRMWPFLGISRSTLGTSQCHSVSCFVGWNSITKMTTTWILRAWIFKEIPITRSLQASEFESFVYFMVTPAREHILYHKESFHPERYEVSFLEGISPIGRTFEQDICNFGCKRGWFYLPNDLPLLANKLTGAPCLKHPNCCMAALLHGREN